MTRFIKIFTIMTGLTLMTACGASGLIDDIKNLIEQAQAELAKQEVTDRLLDDKIVEARFAALPEAERTPEAKAKIEAEVAALVGEERVAARDSFLDEQIIESRFAALPAAERTSDARAQIEADVAALAGDEREAARKEAEGELTDLSGDELAEFNAAIERQKKYLESVVGLNTEEIEARLSTCRGTPDATGCAAVLTNFCYETPFDAACDVNPDETRRTEYIAECGVGTNVGCIDDAGAVCTADSNITGCGAFVTRVCDANPTYTACDGNADYFLAQDNACWIQGTNGGTRTTRCQQIVETNRVPATAEASCRANYVAPTNENRSNRRCFNAVLAVCDLNPFDSFCRHNRNVLNDHPAYILACRNQVPNARFCAGAKASVCDKNPFDELCFRVYTSSNYPTNNDYEDERDTAITECGQTFVAGDRCEDAAEQFCGSATGEGLFNALCLNDPASDTARKPLCDDEKDSATDAISARCTTTAMRICGTIATALDPFCDGVDGYFDDQLSACVLDSNNPSCVVGSPTQFAALELIASCLATPFDAACLDTTTSQGMLFALRAEAAQKTYCEAGTLDQVNCTNIGSLPVFASLARNITQDGIRTFSSDENPVVTNEVNEGNPNIGGFLRTGVFGTKLGDYIGKNSGDFTDETNNGNFDRANVTGGVWTGFPDAYSFGGSLDTIWEGARRDDPADEDTADPNDGFTYFIARKTTDESGNDLAYAGIWQTTNFGAPLAVQPAGDNGNVTAIWAGNFTGYSGAPRLTAKPTNFYVDFTDRTFNIHNPTVGENPKTGTATLAIGSGSALNDPNYYETSTFSYAVNGIFGVGVTDPNILYTNGGVARTLNAGELSGNVTYVNSQFASREDWMTGTTSSENTTIMPLTGLIGVEGALGIFLNPAETTSANVGGFTATAPAPAQ